MVLKSLLPSTSMLILANNCSVLGALQTLFVIIKITPGEKKDKELRVGSVNN